MRKHSRRTQYLVHRGIQGRFTRMLFGISLLYLLGYVYVILSMKQQLAWSFEQVLYACQVTASPMVLDQLRELDAAMLIQMIAMGAVLVIVVGIIGILITHRLAGPLLRIQAVLQALPRSGSVPPLRLRDGDELGEVAAEVNRIVERLHEDGQSDLALLDELVGVVADLAGDGRERASEILAQLRDSRRTHLAE